MQRGPTGLLPYRTGLTVRELDHTLMNMSHGVRRFTLLDDRNRKKSSCNVAAEVGEFPGRKPSRVSTMTVGKLFSRGSLRGTFKEGTRRGYSESSSEYPGSSSGFGERIPQIT